VSNKDKIKRASDKQELMISQGLLSLSHPSTHPSLSFLGSDLVEKMREAPS
jgi:hypothetical protein